MLVSEKELANLKLKAIKADDLKELAASIGVEPKGNAGDLIKKLIGLPHNKIDAFIRTKYQAQVRERQNKPDACDDCQTREGGRRIN